MSPGAVILLLSLAANAALAWTYLAQRDDLTKATEQRDTARVDALACSDATEALRELAAKRQEAAAPARAAAAKAARIHHQRADHTLGLQPSNLADLCASMQVMGDKWLAGRQQ